MHIKVRTKQKKSNRKFINRRRGRCKHFKPKNATIIMPMTRHKNLSILTSDLDARKRRPHPRRKRGRTRKITKATITTKRAGRKRR